MPDQLSSWTAADLNRLNPELRTQLLAYVEFGRAPGAFLTAVLSNNLRETIARSPDITALQDLLKIIEENVPPGARGSNFAVEQWRDRGGERRHRGTVRIFMKEQP